MDFFTSLRQALLPLCLGGLAQVQLVAFFVLVRPEFRRVLRRFFVVATTSIGLAC